jgi:hypothetical protein
MAINLNHGNRLRPPYEAKEIKKQRSRETYAKSMLAIDPCWLNEKILRKIYNLFGLVNLDITLLNEEGFDFNLVGKKIVINHETVFVMKKFGYSIVNQKKIKIWKMY